MKKQDQKQIVGIDEFDRTVSLYQLIGPGAGRGKMHLKLIVDSIHNTSEPDITKPISLLIVGKQGKRTHARAFLRALGLESINEMPAQLLQSSSSAMPEFFSPFLLCDSFIISNIEVLYPAVLKTLYEILSSGQHFGYDHSKRTRQVVPVPVHYPIVLTTHKEEKIPGYFLQRIDHVVKLEDYFDQQLELIVLQRIKYCNLQYEEKILWLITEYGLKDLHKMVRILKGAITFMLSDSRQILTVDDVKKVMAYS